MRISYATLVASSLLLAGMTLTADDAAKTDPLAGMPQLLKKMGAVSYAQKAPYGAGIDAMVIGYGAEGTPVAGLATRKTKTYAEALTLIAVTPKDGAFVITAAEIPDVGSFHGKSQDLAKAALKDITGKVFKDAKEARGLVDAMTGATQYYKAIYVSYALMASKVIEELSGNPDWPRTALQP